MIRKRTPYIYQDEIYAFSEDTSRSPFSGLSDCPASRNTNRMVCCQLSAFRVLLSPSGAAQAPAMVDDDRAPPAAFGSDALDRCSHVIWCSCSYMILFSCELTTHRK